MKKSIPVPWDEQIRYDKNHNEAVRLLFPVFLLNAVVKICETPHKRAKWSIEPRQLESRIRRYVAQFDAELNAQLLSQKRFWPRR